jgi:hypothetical protein
MLETLLTYRSVGWAIMHTILGVRQKTGMDGEKGSMTPGFDFQHSGAIVWASRIQHGSLWHH